jgi:HK97 family phage major capsid protein
MLDRARELFGRTAFRRRHSAPPERGFASLAEQVLAVRRAAVPGGNLDNRLSSRALGLYEASPSDGGFLVQSEFAEEIGVRMFEVGALMDSYDYRPIAKGKTGLRVPFVAETSRVTGSRFGGAQGYWMQEGVALTASRPKWRMEELVLGKVAAILYVTDEMLGDVSFLEAHINQVVPAELAFQFENASINGTGVGMPLGILNSKAVIQVAIEATQTIANTATFLATNLSKMQARMPPANYANAVWLINSDLFAKLGPMTVGGTGGASAIYSPVGSPADAPWGYILNRPVLPVEYTQAEGTVGDIIVFDPTQYLLVDNGGPDAAMSIHVAWLTDEQVFRFTYRVDGQLSWNDVLTPFQGSTTLAPVVTLGARS